MSHLRTTLYLGGNLELEVPIVVKFNFHKGYRGSQMEPPEPASCEIDSAEREDGIGWHDGCQDALDRWWQEDGEAEALQQEADDREYAREQRDEWRREERMMERRE